MSSRADRCWLRGREPCGNCFELMLAEKGGQRDALDGQANKNAWRCSPCERKGEPPDAAPTPAPPMSDSPVANRLREKLSKPALYPAAADVQPSVWATGERFYGPTATAKRDAAPPLLPRRLVPAGLTPATLPGFPWLGADAEEGASTEPLGMKQMAQLAVAEHLLRTKTKHVPTKHMLGVADVCMAEMLHLLEMVPLRADAEGAVSLSGCGAEARAIGRRGRGGAGGGRAAGGTAAEGVCGGADGDGGAGAARGLGPRLEEAQPVR